jgi:hypothetical protein
MTGGAQVQDARMIDIPPCFASGISRFDDHENFLFRSKINQISAHVTTQVCANDGESATLSFTPMFITWQRNPRPLSAPPVRYL